MLITYFKDQNFDATLNKTTEKPYKLKGKDRGDEFSACANCSAISGSKTRIPTGKQ